MMTVTPFQLEIIEGTIESARREMELQVERTARSTVIREQHDYRAAIFDGNGRGISAVSAAAHVRPILTGFRDDLRPGDLFIWNHPYLDTGISHLPDICVTTPVFAEDQVVAFAQIYGHVHDIGGVLAGSRMLSATELFQEGLIIPPVKLFDSGRRNEALYQTILNNSRFPDMLQGDIDAEIAALAIGVRRVQGLVARYGPSLLEEAFQQLLDRCARTLREAVLSQIPDGIYPFEDFVETAGLSAHEPLEFIRVKVTLIKHSDHVVLDFDGTEREVRLPFNCPADGKYYVKYLTSAFRSLAPDIVLNEGSTQVISTRLPEGTVLSPRYPAACAHRHWLLFRLPEVGLGTLAQAVPHLTPGSSDTRSAIGFIARDAQGRSFLMREVIGAGGGGRPGADGLDAVTANVAGRNVPVEFSEAFFPVRIERLSLRPDSGGPGTYRGGLGYVKDIRFLTDGTLLVADDRMLLQPWGANGGRAGLGSEYLLNPGTDREQRIPTKTDSWPIRSGDLLRVLTPGGGGWGDPLEREPGLVERDVRRSLVSEEQARREYGVILDADRCLDRVATGAERDRVRSVRRTPLAERSRGPLLVIDRGERFEALARAGRLSLTTSTVGMQPAAAGG